MELPNWVVDEVLQLAKPTAFRFAVLLYRHGSPRVNSAGDQVLYWRGSYSRLTRLTGSSKPALIDAIGELRELGLLTVHEPLRHKASQAFTVPLGDTARGKKFLPQARSEPAHHDDGSQEPSTRSNFSETSTTTPAHEEILTTLAQERVTDPARWLADYGAERCTLALQIMDETRSAGGVRNPAGFMRMLLESKNLDTRTTLARTMSREQEAEELRRWNEAVAAARTLEEERKRPEYWAQNAELQRIALAKGAKPTRESSPK